MSYARNMSVWRLLLREVLHRKLSFAFGLLAVVAGVATVVTATLLLRYDAARTRTLLDLRERESRQRLVNLRDHVRKAMLRLGFTIVIVPEEDKLDAWYLDGKPRPTMPEAWVRKLAEASAVTVQHAVPRIRQKVKWPETEWTVLLVASGDAPLKATDEARGIDLEAVPEGQVVLGHEIHQALGYKQGGSVTFLGRELTVAGCRPPMGTRDDITVWLHLRDAQALLGIPAQIHEIVALECRSTWADPDKVRAEVARLLPGARAIQRTPQALASAMARVRLAEKTQASLEQERDSRDKILARKRKLVLCLVSLVLLACTAWVALVSAANARTRRTEVGILCAIGFRPRTVLQLFAGRALLTAATGGVLGMAAGWGLATVLDHAPTRTPAIPPGSLFLELLVTSLLTAAAVAVVGSLLPTARAARQDAAAVLRDE